MEQIQISLEGLRNTAVSIRSINEQLYLNMKNIVKQMNDLDSLWKSPAGQEIRLRFHSMVPIIEQHKEVIETYAKFLDTTVLIYEDTEMKIQRQISNFE